MSRVDTVGTSQQRGGGAAQFAPVPRLTITHAGLHTGCTLTPAVARALANELLACAAVYGGE